MFFFSFLTASSTVNRAVFSLKIIRFADLSWLSAHICFSRQFFWTHFYFCFAEARTALQGPAFVGAASPSCLHVFLSAIVLPKYGVGGGYRKKCSVKKVEKGGEDNLYGALFSDFMICLIIWDHKLGEICS